MMLGPLPDSTADGGPGNVHTRGGRSGADARHGGESRTGSTGYQSAWNAKRETGQLKLDVLAYSPHNQLKIVQSGLDLFPICANDGLDIFQHGDDFVFH